MKELSRKERESVAKELRQIPSAKAFLHQYPRCGLTENGLKSVLAKCNVKKKPDRAEALRSVQPRTWIKIARCLNLGPRVFNGFRGINLLMDGDADEEGVPIPDRSTRAMVGDYMYIRRKPSSGLDIGGLRLFIHCDFPRFMHFFDFQDLMAWRKADPDFFGEGNLTASGHRCADVDRKLDTPPTPYKGSGFFLVKGSDLTIVSFDNNTARTSFGKAANPALLRVERVEMHVAGRADDQAKFAARASLYHQTHKWFGKNFDDDTAATELGEDKLTKDAKSRKGHVISIL